MFSFFTHALEKMKESDFFFSFLLTPRVNYFVSKIKGVNYLKHVPKFQKDKQNKFKVVQER